MSKVHPIRPDGTEEEPQALALHDRAMDNLRYIRETMERAGSFTAVPGWGSVALGVTALAAAWLAARQTTPEAWLLVWISEALLALLIGGWTVARKARAVKMPVLSGPGRKVALSLLPMMVAGATLTAVLYGEGLISALPSVWLLLYGAGVIAAGLYSVRIVPAMGMSFMLLGVITAFAPDVLGDVMLAVGFGGLHLLFGLLIAWRHGG